jgi:uncharacterized membrane protein
MGMSNMKKRLFAAVFSAVLIVSPIFGVSAQYPPGDEGNPTTEEVSSFAADIVVHESGHITVTEKIEYFFPQPRHGIFRDIPTRYKMDDGRVLIVPVKISSVSGAPYDVINLGSSVRVKIGDPDATVTGLQSYTITYEAVGALRYFDDHDELYWNVTGHSWEVPLRRVTAAVHLPSAVDQEAINLDCFMGPAGSNEYKCLYNRNGKTAHFAADDFLTVVVGWNPGVVAKVEAKESSFYNEVIAPSLPFLVLALLIPIGTFIYLFRRWRRTGRDPEGLGTVVARYSPPKNLTPAETGVIIDEKVDMKDISATIIDLAVRGYLTIKDEKSKLLSFKKNFAFTLVKNGYANGGKLKPHEKKILDVMFEGRGVVTLETLVDTHAFHGNLKGIRSDLYAQSVNSGFFKKNPETVRAKYLGIGVAGMVLGFIGLFMAAPIISFVTGPLGAMALFAAIVVAGVLFLFFAKAMPAKTEQGMETWDHARGFKEYLKTAEKYRLEWQEKEKIFETFLPYAMVFNVVDQWSDTFKNLDIEPPEWYEGSAVSGGVFDVAAFTTSMSSLQSGMNRALASSPQKSSSGSGFSGGSSGGGFGGGGGGSW